MMDFFERLSDYLLESIELQSATVNSEGEKEISFKPLEDNELGIAVLDAPSSTNDRYIDRTRSYEWMVQVIVKNTNQKAAFDDAMSIYQELDDFPRPDKSGKIITLKSENDSFILRSSEGYTMPRLIEITEHKAFMYSFIIRTDLLIKAK